MQVKWQTLWWIFCQVIYFYFLLSVNVLLFLFFLMNGPLLIMWSSYQRHFVLYKVTQALTGFCDIYIRFWWRFFIYYQTLYFHIFVLFNFWDNYILCNEISLDIVMACFHTCGGIEFSDMVTIKIVELQITLIDSVLVSLDVHVLLDKCV